MRPFNLFSAAAVALSLAFVHPALAQPAPAPASCAEAVEQSPTGFAILDGASCVAFGGRFYADCPNCGIDAGAVRGEIQLDQLAPAARPGGNIYAPNATRFNRAIVIDMGAAAHPAAGTFALVKLPARVASDDALRAVVRTDTSTGTVRQQASALINRGGGQITWGELSGGHWVLIAGTPDGWVLLD